MSKRTRADCLAFDAEDPVAGIREEFLLPPDLVYLDGNSLGALARSALDRVVAVARDEWGRDLIRSWTGARWWARPSELGLGLAPLLGTAPGEVVVCDSTSVNLFKVLAAALALRPGRHAIVSDPNSFPGDLYILESVAEMLGGFELRLVDSRGHELDAALDEEAAVLVLSHVDYVTAEIEDMAGTTARAHEAGALAVWDVSHSVGAIPVHLDECDVDLAVGCTYKYLNGGPGSPAFVFAATRLHERIRQPLSGWNAHARPFGFERDFAAATGVERFRTGTPPMLAYAPLEAALEIWGSVELSEVFGKGSRLGDLFIELVDEQLDGSGLELLSPRDAARRGSHVAYHHPHARQLVAGLDATGVIADYREPEVVRFGLAPLYLRYVEIWDAVERLGEVLALR